jgi:hypothetical protein
MREWGGLRECGLSPEEAGCVLDLVGRMENLFADIRLAENYSSGDFRAAVEKAWSKFHNLARPGLWPGRTEYVRTSVVAVLTTIVDSFGYKGGGSWAYYPSEQALGIEESTQEEYDDLIHNLGYLVAFPREAQLLRTLLDISDGPYSQRMGHLIRMGETLEKLTRLDPHLQIAGPGLEALVALEDEWSGPAAYDRVTDEVLATLERVTQVALAH